MTRVRRVISGASDALAKVPRLVKVATVLILVVVAFAVAVPLTLMANPSYLGRLHGLSDNYESLETSLHAGLSCSQCHVDERGWAAHSVAVTRDFYRTLFSAEAAPEYLEMLPPPRESCVACHEHDWTHDAERLTRIPHPAHLRVADESRDCVECHKWTAHLEEYIEQHAASRLSGVCALYGCHSGWASDDRCSDCHHVLLDEPAEWAGMHAQAVLARGDAGCLELCHESRQCRQCHNVGETPFTGELSQTERDVVEALHAKADWSRRHGSVALEEPGSCSTCHVSSGPCISCHSQRPASHGPETTWISAHKNSVKSDEQCITCHEPSWCEDCHAQFKESD